ncbi:MAG: hypothetical protein ACPGTP_09370 [Bacteroidia bacterium]
MRVSAETSIKDIKDRFAKEFKGLRLEFFVKSHESVEGSHKKDMIRENKTAGELNPDIRPHNVRWKEEMTVNDLEQYFEDELGLHVQVFRLTGINWLETTTTDDYTLTQQMRKSAETQTA